MLVANRFDEFIQLLTQLPPKTWIAVVTEEPEWKWMYPLSEVWKYGHFAVLFITLGLNDYQLKGKAEIAYWPKVVPLVPRQPDPTDPLNLIVNLEPFYSRERLQKDKLNRLHRFIESDLCHRIWASNPNFVASDFGQIWQALGRTMYQKPEMKTIAFAMKCLALSLLMFGETNFNFGAIPIPVDSRIRNVSKRLGLPSVDDATERNRWREVLNRIRIMNPEVTMVHLDSLLWQISPLSPKEMESHLIKLGAGDLASRISRLFNYVDF